ncbi:MULTISPECIES: hypothetical protein [unclassified Pseudomonas]|uniref:hypothetical protein n=1 Tax=unclassified Pseudomonas TaxID=196821 RepID=UPI0013008BB7|nr:MULTISPECIES: hypothetical protein [unclassified Pseudomonas]QJI14006.1 hypothetical protein HKK58_16185 [Pseudomonas sp. ADAK22]
MTHAAHIAFIEHELNGFHQSLAEYRQQMGAWYARALDTVSHAADSTNEHGKDNRRRIQTGRLRIWKTEKSQSFFE